MLSAVSEPSGPLTFCWNCLADRAAAPEPILYDYGTRDGDPFFVYVPKCSICGGSLTNVTPHFVKPEER